MTAPLLQVRNLRVEFPTRRGTLLALDDSTPEGAEILKLNRASRYIETKPENYKGLEATGRSAGLL